MPQAFSYDGDGTVVPFRFNGRIPQVEGRIDGIPGKFDIDTGSRASLALFGPFVEKHDLKAHYARHVEAVTGWGIGGPVRALVARAKSLELGAVRIEDIVVDLSLQSTGAFVDPYVAGNVGAAVLKRFNLVFDYDDKRVIFEPNANSRVSDPYDRSGMWINLAEDGFTVVDVVRGGPAEQAGIKPGDTILAIDGRTFEELGLSTARQRLRTEAPGTRLRAKVRSGSADRDVVLVLRELI
jgi:hypothetical protein